MIVAARFYEVPIENPRTQDALSFAQQLVPRIRRCRGCDGCCDSSGGCTARQAFVVKIAARTGQPGPVQLTLSS